MTEPFETSIFISWPNGKIVQITQRTFETRYDYLGQPAIAIIGVAEREPKRRRGIFDDLICGDPVAIT
jgi:hypothetical protein